MSTNIFIENSRFIFDTNFAGDPSKDFYGSDQRKGNIIIPDHALAEQMIEDGFNVKMTKPSKKMIEEGRTDEFQQEYFVKVIANFNSQWPPRVYLITEDGCDVSLNEKTVGQIDRMWIEKVNVVLNPYEGPRGKSLYIKSMEVFQKASEDPISRRHTRKAMDESISDDTDREELPFD